MDGLHGRRKGVEKRFKNMIIQILINIRRRCLRRRLKRGVELAKVTDKLAIGKFEFGGSSDRV